jgi:hypothetical protein
MSSSDLPAGLSRRKVFSDEEKQQIDKYRSENTQIEVIAILMKCGKERIRRYLKDEKGETLKGLYEKTRIAQAKDVDIAYPDFSQALCKEHDGSIWFPRNLPEMNGTQRAAEYERIAKAIKICNSCPIQIKCLDYALRAEPFGIWGGATEAERVYLRARHNIVCVRDGKVFIHGIGRRNSQTAMILRESYAKRFLKSEAVRKYIEMAS